MMQRRGVLASTLMLGGLLAGGRPAWADVDPAAAGQFIQTTAAELIHLMTGARDAEARRQRLQPFIERVVDVDGVAQFCIGRAWQTATPEQRATYLRLFRLVLVNSIAGHLGDYSPGDVAISTGRPSPRPEGMLVPTTIMRPNNKPVSISWLVADVGGQLRIVDVMAEGVSLRITQRSDYAAFLNKNSGQAAALIDAMQHQVDTLHLS